MSASKESWIESNNRYFERATNTITTTSMTTATPTTATATAMKTKAAMTV